VSGRLVSAADTAAACGCPLLQGPVVWPAAAGRVLPLPVRAGKLLHITGQAFDRVLWHLQRTLQELKVQREGQQAILVAVQARRDEVVTFEESS
jgi:hypothetical protein